MGSLYTSSGDCRQKFPTEFLDQKESPLGAIPRAALEQVWLERQLELLLERATDDCKLAIFSHLIPHLPKPLHLERKLFAVEVGVDDLFPVPHVVIRKKFFPGKRSVIVLVQKRNRLQIYAVGESTAEQRPLVLLEHRRHIRSLPYHRASPISMTKWQSTLGSLFFEIPRSKLTMLDDFHLLRLPREMACLSHRGI